MLPYRIFIVEDHPVLREIYLQLLAREPTFAVCGQASTGADALIAIAERSPDIVLIDIALPDMNGLVVLRRLLKADPQLPVLILSSYGDDIYTREALATGARGYLDKLELAAMLPTAIRSVLDGKMYVSTHRGKQVHNKNLLHALPLS